MLKPKPPVRRHRGLCPFRHEKSRRRACRPAIPTGASKIDLANEPQEYLRATYAEIGRRSEVRGHASEMLKIEQPPLLAGTKALPF